MAFPKIKIWIGRFFVPRKRLIISKFIEIPFSRFNIYYVSGVVDGQTGRQVPVAWRQSAISVVKLKQ